MWQVTAMFSLLKITFETRIRSLSWLDEPTRKDALHKLASLRGHFLTWPQLWKQPYVASLLQDVSCPATQRHAVCMWHYACSSLVSHLSNCLLRQLPLYKANFCLEWYNMQYFTKVLEKNCCIHPEDGSSGFLTILVNISRIIPVRRPQPKTSPS